MHESSLRTLVSSGSSETPPSVVKALYNVRLEGIRQKKLLLVFRRFDPRGKHAFFSKIVNDFCYYVFCCGFVYSGKEPLGNNRSDLIIFDRGVYLL